MNYNIISTGSKGNAVVINKEILIDCGVPFKALVSIVNDIKLVLLTHEHGDHFNRCTIKRLSRERPTLRFACCGWLEDMLRDEKIPHKSIDVLEPGKKYNYGKFCVSPVKLYHNVPNCGWRIYWNGERLFYATDTNTLEGITAKDYDLYMIECNYEDREIQDRIREKQERGQYAYENKVIHNHLSKAKCDDFIVSNAGDNSAYVYLHMHEGVKYDD